MALPDALDRFNDIAGRLDGRRVAVFLDYDGTLVPIAARPDLAVLPDGMRATLRALAAECDVAVVSGRDLADIRRLVALDRLVYAGSHGFDIAGPNGLRMEHERSAAFAAAVKDAAAALGPPLAEIAGTLVEPKRFAVAVHYRQVAPERVSDVEAAVDAVLASQPGLLKTLGKKVFELRPRFDWDKGKAVLWLLSALDRDGPGFLPLYVGDDLTDEDAFLTLRGRGVTIAVGAPGGTAAEYGLADPERVERFLAGLARFLALGPS